MRDLMHLPVWPIILILGYPALAIAVLEFARRLAVRAPFASGILRQVAYVLLPTVGIWLIVRVLAEFPAGAWVATTAKPTFCPNGRQLCLSSPQTFASAPGQCQIRSAESVA